MFSAPPNFTFYGIPVRTLSDMPKARVPVRPHTDDMRAMVEDLIRRGQGSPQTREVDQVIIIADQMIGPPDLVRVLLDDRRQNARHL